MKTLLKYITGTLLAATLLLVSGCSFLDVTPRESSKSNDLFSSEDGFKYALTGVYLSLSNKKLYGTNTSLYMPELLCQHWKVNPTDRSSELYIFSNYDFSDFKGDQLLSTVWTEYYHTIAQLNDILENISDSGASFSSRIKELVEGEAYGLRGFLHMEVLRYWGPVPSQATATTQAVPYVDEVTLQTDPLSPSTWKKVVDGILSDLNNAERILRESDPLVTISNNSLNHENGVTPSPLENWLNYRQNRFNYVAVLAAKARLYHWIAPSGIYPQAQEEAVRYAKMVVDFKTEDTDVLGFELTDGLTLKSSGYTMFGESIFSLHAAMMQENIKDLLKAETPQLYQDKELLNAAYEMASGFGVADIRYTASKMWEEKRTSSGGQYMHLQKYGGNTDFHDALPDRAKNQVPVIRLSEMYLILIESLPIGEAADYFSRFRIARSLPENIEASFTAETRLSMIESEYRKEFFGEGQMFFFYKRHDYTTITWPGFQLPNGLSDYVLPRPKSQTQFEN